VKRVVLASASPRRRALLESLGLDLAVAPSDVEEHFEGGPEEMVVSNGRALGKPANLDEAREMIARLSGATHQVITGVAVCDTESGAGADGAEATDVTFRELTEDEIDAFVETVQPLDRAGAYTVDGPGSLLVARYEGCYQNVLGLPMVRLDTLLRDIGFRLFEHLDRERATFL